MGPNAEKQTMVYNVNRTTDVTDRFQWVGKRFKIWVRIVHRLCFSISLDLMLTMQRNDVNITIVYMNIMNASDLEGGGGVMVLVSLTILSNKRH